jgi:uncharacterized protein (DUF4415 family)
MAKRKKTSLKTALKKVDHMPASSFGKIDIDINTLPCLSKPKKVKITANFDEDLLEKVREFAEEKNTSYTSIMNDVLRKVFIDDKKAS